MQITLGDLIAKLREARSKMSTANANKLLFGQCEAVILELAERLAQAEHKEEPRIILP